jgi:HPt (histidine-containing phosphotransfer) domain-containing protein
MAPPDIQSELAALRRGYVAGLPDRARRLRDAFAELDRAFDTAAATELRRLCHNLAGSGASYGFPEVSAAARRAELLLDASIGGTALAAGALEAIEGLVLAADAAASG